MAASTAEPNEFPKHSGGSWYELSDGTKVQGESNAIEQQKKLGEPDV